MSAISKELIGSIKPFGSLEIDMWFELFEDAMTKHKLDTEDNKYHLIICLLPPKVTDLSLILLKYMLLLLVNKPQKKLIIQ